jgi:hypothetical protein
MASVPELEREFLTDLGAALGGEGFKPALAQQSFDRKTPWGRQSFHVMFNPRGVLRAAIDANVRFDRVEELVHSVNPTIPKNIARRTATIGAELGQYASGVWRDFEIGSQEQIARAASEAVELCKTAGLRWLERFSNLEEALPELTREGVGDVRALRAVAVAFVLGRRDVFEEQRRVKQALLTSRRDPYAEQFRQLCEYLEEHWDKEPRPALAKA